MKYQSKFLGCFSEKMGISWVHNFSILNPESWGWQRFSIYMARRPIKKRGEEMERFLDQMLYGGNQAWPLQKQPKFSPLSPLKKSVSGRTRIHSVTPWEARFTRGNFYWPFDGNTLESWGNGGMRYDLDCIWGNHKAVHACTVHKNVRGNIVLYWACGQYSHYIRPQRIQTH